MNARFWQWTRNGWVKLTLRPGETIVLLDGGPTEEGWFREAIFFEHTGDGVTREAGFEALDCDGRLDRFDDSYCPLDALSARDTFANYACAENDGIFAPAWERQAASQRDYAAEAAGY